MKKFYKKTKAQLLSSVSADIFGKALTTNIRGLEREDIVQELNMGLLKRIDKFDPKRASFRTFAQIVMRNIIKDLAKKAEMDFRTTYSADIQEKFIPNDNPDDNEGVVNVYQDILASDKWLNASRIFQNIDIARAMTLLSDKEVVIVKAHIFQDLDFFKISKLLKISERTTRSYWQSACQKLRSKLANYRYRRM